MTDKWDTLVIGGGASGLAAAVTSGRMGDRTLLIERHNLIGKKLAATGNGRCNLMNLGKRKYYGDAAFANQVLDLCDVSAQRRFWHELGLILKEESDGLVYPATAQSSSVLDALKLGLKMYGVEIQLNCTAQAIRKAEDGFEVLTDSGVFRGKRIILAAGGKAFPKLGGSDDSLNMLRKSGHSVTAPFPALTPLNTDGKSISGLSGLRVPADLRLTRDAVCLHREKGEVLFTDYGISGICVMQCARFVTDPPYLLHLDLSVGTGLNPQTFQREIRERRQRFAMMVPDMLLKGMLPSKLSYAVCKQAGIPLRGERIQHLSDQQIESVAQRATDYRLTVTGTRGFDQAQVMAGGADCGQFRPSSLESRLVPGFHVTGESLNVDGDCGGFNLMFAFASGILAGLNNRSNPWGEG